MARSKSRRSPCESGGGPIRPCGTTPHGAFGSLWSVGVEPLAQVDRVGSAALIDVTYLLLAVLLLFSVVLGVSILFNTTTQNILERERELGTMRALGLPMARLEAMLTLEHALLAGLGIALGVPLGLATLRYTVSLYDRDLFSLPFVLSPTTAAVSMLGVALVLLAAQWPALREVARLDLAGSVRGREG